MKLWLLVFMFNGQPAVSGPHLLEVCLMMARDQTEISGVKAHCWNSTTSQRHRERPSE